MRKTRAVEAVICACLVLMFGGLTYMIEAAVEAGHPLSSQRRYAPVKFALEAIGQVLGLGGIASLTLLGVIACGVWGWRVYMKEQAARKDIALQARMARFKRRLAETARTDPRASDSA